MKRHTLPETDSRKQTQRARRKHTERVVYAVIFTAVELWAIVAAIVLLDDSGVLAVAVAVVLSAALIAVWDTWQSVLTSGRTLRSSMPEQSPTEGIGPDHRTNLVRL